MTVVSLLEYAIENITLASTDEGRIELRGWIAGPTDSNLLVRLRIGPKTVYDCQTGIARPDVASVHPKLAGAAHSGFSLDVHIPPGFHIGTLEYNAIDETDWIPFHSFSIIAKLSPLFFHLETEAPTEKMEGTLWLFYGWCFHPQCDIENLSIQFSNRKAELRFGEERPDVAAVHSQYRSAQCSGFSGQLQLEQGNGPLYLTATLANGSILRKTLLPSLIIPNASVVATQRKVDQTRASLIRLQAFAEPEVSIIIPIYNQLELTLGCLESLVRHAGSTSFEVIVIDDKSESYVREILLLVKNLRLYSNAENQGFVLNCNRGARDALGNYLLFLNNDTEVTAGWLESMMAVFRDRPKAGAVGAKLVYPDGRLQEAGGLLWDDGSGLNFGKFDDPDRPEYNYLRQVDYCSGACLLVPRDLFFQVGCFDTRYKPAYYEDAALAFAIRASGREVYYQPAARITHFEGVSSGTDVRRGVKHYQVLNQRKFTEQWGEILADHGSDGTLQNVARDRYASCRILVIDACALTPDADSGSLRMFNLLTILAQTGAKVTFGAENLQSYEPFSTQLRQSGVEHLQVPHIYNLRQYLEANAYAFDFIIISRKHIAQKFVDIARRAAPNARIVFDTVDLMFLRLERQAEHEVSPELKIEAARCKAIELSLCKESDLVFVVSQVEAEMLAHHIPREKIALVSNIHRLYPSSATFAKRRGLMFVGGYQHPPNVDAVDFFLYQVLPLVRPRIPNLEVHIIGSNMPDRWKQRDDQFTHLHGFVADLNPLYEKVRVVIAPLRYGAGVKGKVNQAMAHGVPVVATTMAIEGMHLEHNRDVLVADSAKDFADEVVRLYEDEDLWSKIAAAGLTNIKQHFSFEAVRRNVLTALYLPFEISVPAPRQLPRRPPAEYKLGELIRFGLEQNANAYLREGWSIPDERSCWIVGNRASMELELISPQYPTQIIATVYPLLAAPQIPRQRLQLLLNSAPVDEPRLVEKSELIRIVWDLSDPKRLINQTMNLTFHCPDSTAPHDHNLSADVRMLSFAMHEIQIL